MSGSGKSTLASALCHHNQIKGHFEKIIYITVSKSPNIMDILENIWENIVGDRKPGFQNVEEAHIQLQCQINSRRNQPTLVVLDDVCSRSNLQKLLFQGEHYKTLVTTRDERIIRKQQNVYLFRLPFLQEDHALSLFCHYAFGQLTIPASHDEELVKQVQAECKGLPLTLQVIGSSLCGEPSPVWQIAKNKLSRGETISSYHKEELHERLKATSIDVLEDNVKQCFLDLAVFPQGRTFSANALLDIWVYVHGMDWEEAFMVLRELSARSLLELKTNPWSPGITHGCEYGLTFSQHAVMRDLVLFLVEQDNIFHCSRLCMPEKCDCIPSKWQTVHPSKSQIVPIHTGTMDEKRWPQIEFPEAEALVLYFTASRYYIPTFLHTMKNLKVLIIHNCSARRATLNGLEVFNALSQLKTLHLERLLVPPLYDYFNFLVSLEKLSLSLCEGLGNMSELGGDEFFNFPKGELLFSIKMSEDEDCELIPKASVNTDDSLIIMNVHPIEYGHVLLVPRAFCCLPQMIDINSFELAIEIAAAVNNCFFRIGYNSLGAFATVNHLHFQAYYLANPLPVEVACTQLIPGDWQKSGLKIFEIVDYPVKGLLFEVGQNLGQMAEVVATFCCSLQNKNMPFNILISDCGTRIFLFPQCFADKCTRGMIEEDFLQTKVNPSVWEIAGHIVFNRNLDYDHATEQFVRDLLAVASLNHEEFEGVKFLCTGIAEKICCQY